MSNELVECEKLVYVYTDDAMGINTYALKGVDLKVNSGEFVAILGRNGSGKSTISKLINGLFTPTEGIVYVEGLDTKDEKNIWDIRKTCGMVFQNPDNQIVATIVEEDVAFGPENLGIEPKEIRKRVDSSLKKVGMEEFKKHAPHMLSGGQKQRVAIAGILAMNPKCIIFDEATAMLDPSGRKEVISTIEELKAAGITIILITHYMEEAVKADRVIVMDSGDIIRDGSPKEVFTRVKEMKELGLDVPQMSELAYMLKEEGINLKSDILSIDEMVSAICQLR